MGIEEHRGPRIDDVERFDGLLPLAVGISRHAGHLFEIDLPGAHRAGPLQGLTQALSTLGNPLMSLEHAVHGLARRDRQRKELHRGIAF